MLQTLKTFLLFSFLLSTLCALPLSNVANPTLYAPPGLTSSELCEGISLRFGYYGDFVFHKYIYDSDPRLAGRLRNFQIYTNAAEFILNFQNCLEFFGTVGQTDQSFIGRISNSQLYECVDLPATSWSTGIRYAADWRGITWGLVGQYFHYRASINYDVLFSLGVLQYAPRSARHTYDEWQGGIGAAYKIESCEYFDFVPYIGVIAFGARMFEDYNIPMRTTYSSRGIASFALGATVLLERCIGVTAEGRFGAEKALYVSGQFRF